MDEGSLKLENREKPELSLELSRDDRTLLILQRIRLIGTGTSELAATAIEQLMQAQTDTAVTISFTEPEHSADWVQALRYEIDRERLQYGDVTVAERQEFLERRRPIQEGTRQLRKRLHREYFCTTDEALTEHERTESKLYEEIDGIVQNMSEAMGFQRPIVLELTRNPTMNAYVLRAEKLDEDFMSPSTEPVHVFVQVGMITKLRDMFKEQDKVFTKDHLASIIGHELRHLQQKKYQPDEHRVGKQADEQVRFEYDADLGGMEGADLAGYNPKAAIELQRVLLAANKKGNWREVIEHYFTQTHPITESRLTALEEEYHRPERIIYNADQPYEQFSEAALDDAAELARERLLQQFETARTVEDWETILTDIENNPRATMRDGLMALDVFRLQLDVRTALSAVHECLAHDTFGYRSALVYEANLVAAGESLNCSLFRLRKPDNHFSRVASDDDYRGKVLGDLARDPTPDDVMLFDAASISPEAMDRAVEFHRQHVVLVPPEQRPTGPFASLEDIFDHTNRAAVKFWQLENHTPSRLPDAFQEKRIALTTNLTQRWLRGFEFEYTLHDQESIDLKEAALAIFAEQSAKTADTITTAALPTLPKNLAELAAVAVARLSRAQAETSSAGTTGQTYTYRPERKHSAHFHPFQHAARIPDTTLAETSFGQVYVRLEKILREKFAAATAPEQIQAITGEPAQTPTAAVQNELFQRATRDTVYPRFADKVIPINDLADLKQWQLLPSVMRALPVYGESHRYSRLPFAQEDVHDYVGRVDRVARPLLEIMAGAIGMDIHGGSIDIGTAVQQVRTLQNHPYIQALYRHQYTWKPSTEIAAVAASAYAAPAFYEKPAQRFLYQRWVNEGLRANLTEVTQPAWLQEMTTILSAKAEALGLPSDYFLSALKKLPKKTEPTELVPRLQQLLYRALVKTGLAANFDAARNNAMQFRQNQVIAELEVALSRVATELYVSTMAEDAEELQAVVPYDTGELPIRIKLHDQA